MIFDFLILLPVTVFLLWLFWYSAPTGQSARARLADFVVGLLAFGGALFVLAWLHATLSIEGMDKNILAVASSYLTLLAVLGVGWGLRRSRRNG